MNLRSHLQKFRAFLPYLPRKNLRWYISTFVNAIGLIFVLENWPSALREFVFGENHPGAAYRLRNGFIIEHSQWSHVSNILCYFVRKDYGEISPSATVIDIGASIFPLLQRRETQVFAYEPDPESFDLLRRNIERNGLGETVTAFRLGVAGRKERRKFTVSRFSVLNSFYLADGKAIEVDCVRLQDIFEDNKIPFCDILKLDCEGAEYEILYGAPDACLKKIKEIRMEYHMQSQKTKDKRQNLESNAQNIDESLNPTRGEPNKLVSYLREKGFEVTRFRKDAETSGIIWLKRIEAESRK